MFLGVGGAKVISLRLERKFELQAWEAGEITVVGAESGAVLDGEGGEVGVHDEGATSAIARE